MLVVSRDAQLKHLKRWKITLLHLQPNFLRCPFIEVSLPTYIIPDLFFNNYIKQNIILLT